MNAAAPNILVVEDESSIASFVALYLKNAGYVVRTAANGSEAVGMMTSIKSAEEAFKGETFIYFDVSSALTNWYPDFTGVPMGGKVQWGAGSLAGNWKTLGVLLAMRSSYQRMPLEVPEPTPWVTTMDS